MKSLSLNIAITLLAWSAVAPAHTHLQKAAPADGSVVTVSPARVVLDLLGSCAPDGRVDSKERWRQGQARASA